MKRLWIAGVLLGVVAVAQTSPDRGVEVTKEDFLALPKIVSTNLSTFGVRLGMKEEDALKALSTHCSQCSAKEGSEAGETDITVGYDTKPAFCIYIEHDAVDRIEWLQTLKKYLAGRS